MPFEIPSLDKLSRDLAANMAAELPETSPYVWPNNLRILLKSLVPAFRAVYIRMSWLYDQAFVSTAETEALERKGSDYGVTRLAATYAGGSVLATTDLGTIIPAGARLLWGATGAGFLTIVSTTATAATSSLLLQAEDTGPAGNLAPGSTLVFETPISGASATVTVDDVGLSGGSDIESDASLRARILDKIRTAPHGGSPSEWITWTLDHPGVTNVFVQRATPVPGAVTILFMMYGVYADGLPHAGDVAGVLAMLQDMAPSDVDIHVAAPTGRPVDVTVRISPDTPAYQEAVTSELKAMFRRRATPGSALQEFIFARSWIGEAVSIAMGDSFHLVSLPADDVICGAGEIATLASVTFV